MAGRKAPSELEMTRAAEARAEGNCWEVVGEMLNRAAVTVRQWPWRYPERWEAAMKAAGERVLVDAGAEGIFKLRALLRNVDDKLVMQAAKLLARERYELAKITARRAPAPPKPVPTEAQLIADFVEAHSKEQLIAIARNLLKGRVPLELCMPGDVPARDLLQDG
jgi:hypothetical protein